MSRTGKPLLIFPCDIQVIHFETRKADFVLVVLELGFLLPYPTIKLNGTVLYDS